MKNLTKSEIIEKILNAELCIKNDASAEQLNKVLKIVFPKDNNRASGSNNFYYVSNYNRNYWDSCNNTFKDFITVIEFLTLKDEELTFPREMWVNNSNNFKDAKKRVVFAYKCNEYIAWVKAKTFKEAELKTETARWDFAWELDHKESIFPIMISSTDAQSLINAACDPSKEKLSDLWAKNIVLRKDIEVSEEFYTEMYKICTSDQKKLVDQMMEKYTK